MYVALKLQYHSSQGLTLQVHSSASLDEVIPRLGAPLANSSNHLCCCQPPRQIGASFVACWLPAYVRSSCLSRRGLVNNPSPPDSQEARLVKKDRLCGRLDVDLTTPRHCPFFTLFFKHQDVTLKEQIFNASSVLECNLTLTWGLVAVFGKTSRLGLLVDNRFWIRETSPSFGTR